MILCVVSRGKYRYTNIILAIFYLFIYLFILIFVSGIKNGAECACLQNVFQDLKYVVDDFSKCNVTCRIGQSEYSCGGLNSISVYVASKLNSFGWSRVNYARLS